MDALRAVNRLYGDYSKDLPVACKRGCATCCTQNVTMTTLEGHGIWTHLVCTGREHLLQEFTALQERLRPYLTTNEFAALCLKGEDPPEENNHSAGDPCPFLLSNECLIYQARPFGCRCFFSMQACHKETCAVMDPFLLTVNTVFLQFIEHMDRDGFFGNLLDILAFLQCEETQGHKETRGTHSGDDRSGHQAFILGHNRAIPALLIPPEHQKRIKPLLTELEGIFATLFDGKRPD